MDASRAASTVLRPYRREDAAETLQVFTDAITRTASADYDPEQIDAWARPGRRDLAEWHAAMDAKGSVVAVDGHRVVGFSDVSSGGYIDMMYVSPAHLGRGVARLLLDWDTEQARLLGAIELTSHVSKTARPFFERNGFTVVVEQRLVREGIELVNYTMRKTLVPVSEPASAEQ